MLHLHSSCLFSRWGDGAWLSEKNTPQNWSPSGSSDVRQTRTGGNIIHILLLPIFSVLLPVSGERGHIKTICPPEFLLDPPSSSNPCREASGWGGVGVGASCVGSKYLHSLLSQIMKQKSLKVLGYVNWPFSRRSQSRERLLTSLWQKKKSICMKIFR